MVKKNHTKEGWDLTDEDFIALYTAATLGTSYDEIEEQISYGRAVQQALLDQGYTLVTTEELKMWYDNVDGG